MPVARTSALIVCGISCLLSPWQGSTSYTIRGEVATPLFLQEACIYVTRFEVNERGLIEVPFAGEVKAAGKTVAELSADLISELKKYTKDPKVHVRITEGRT